MDSTNRILVIDDESQIRKLLKVSLKSQGFYIEESHDGRDGINKVAIIKPDLVILDLGLPDMDGKEVIREIREWSNVPIVILTARDQEQEKIEALDNGADDYITKPFGIGELLARIRVCLRRKTEDENEHIFNFGGLIIDLVNRRITVDNMEIKLTPTEYEIIKVLAQNAGKVITHKQLLKKVWGNAYDNDNNYIRVYIGQIRRKIEPNPAQPCYIITESGVGYRLICK